MFDPRHPVPTVGGNMSSLVGLMPRPAGAPDIPVEERERDMIGIPGAFDQREDPRFLGSTPPYLPLASRPDVLVWQSEPLARDLEVTGPVTVTLWVSSDAPDTDVTAKLIDVYPPSADYPFGFAMNLTDSILRLRYRNGGRPEPLTPGQPTRCAFALYPDGERLPRRPPRSAGHLVVQLSPLRRQPQHGRAAVGQRRGASGRQHDPPRRRAPIACHAAPDRELRRRAMPSSAFGNADFKVFDVKGFQPRMQELRARIRPKLETLGHSLVPPLQHTTGEATFAHVAKHARRTVNPPDDTWVAFAGNQRDYKKHPHFKVAVSRNCVRFLFEIGPEHERQTAVGGGLAAERAQAGPGPQTGEGARLVQERARRGSGDGAG